MRADQYLPFREGVPTRKPTKTPLRTTNINVGLSRDVTVVGKIPLGSRLTVRMPREEEMSHKTCTFMRDELLWDGGCKWWLHVNM